MLCGYKEITVVPAIKKGEGRARTARERTIPTSGEIFIFIVAFL
jgi:hypothetical protein